MWCKKYPLWLQENNENNPTATDGGVEKSHTPRDTDHSPLFNESAHKTEPQDLIDLNGYNSDDNYQCFKTIRQKSTSSSSHDSKDLISFDGSTPCEPYKGPRHCSVRLQPGSNNILLDNAAQFSSPILYKRRQCNETSEPSVHAIKSRTSSLSSGYSERKMSTETEI